MWLKNTFGGLNINFICQEINKKQSFVYLS